MLGFSGSGKTILLASLYRHFAHGGRAGVRFVTDDASNTALVRVSEQVRGMTSQFFPAGTRAAETCNWSFDVRVESGQQDATAFSLAYLDYAGQHAESLLGPSTDDPPDEEFFRTLSRADVLMGLIDGASLKKLMDHGYDADTVGSIERLLNILIRSGLAEHSPRAVQMGSDVQAGRCAGHVLLLRGKVRADLGRLPGRRLAAGRAVTAMQDAWPFLIGRTRSDDHRIVVIPAFMTDAPWASALRSGTGGEPGPAVTAWVRELRVPGHDAVTAVYRIFLLDAADFGLPGHGLLTDRVGRPLPAAGYALTAASYRKGMSETGFANELLPPPDASGAQCTYQMRNTSGSGTAQASMTITPQGAAPATWAVSLAQPPGSSWQVAGLSRAPASGARPGPGRAERADAARYPRVKGSRVPPLSSTQTLLFSV